MLDDTAPASVTSPRGRPISRGSGTVTPLAQLLSAVQHAGSTITRRGGMIEVRPASCLTPELRRALIAQQPELWDYLGGAALDAPPLALLQQLEVGLLLPTSPAEALAA